MHKYVKIKKHTSEQPMGQRRNQKGNLKKKKSCNQCKRKQNISNLWDAKKLVLRGEFTAINV